MAKRWAAWPPGIRWLAGIAAVVLVAAIVWALFVKVPDWLARHDVGSATPALQTARDAARGRLLTLGAGLLAAGALIFTARNFILSREGQVTDRYTKAVEQLGSKELDVRIGGIYALERIARDSDKDHPTVMEVLTAFIWEHSREPWPVDSDGAQHGEKKTLPGVQAAVTVVGRRDAKRDIRRIDLTGADLTRASLRGAYLALPANVARALPADALPADVFPGGADLTDAHLVGADLDRANLRRANLRGADLTDAFLVSAHLDGADLTFATLTGANLDGADLTDTRLARADLTRADLRGAILTGTFTRMDLESAELLGARWPEGARVPDGWMVDSGRLKRTGQLSEVTAHYLW
jgi:hypothetical protein